MFDIGFWELAVIAVVALLVIGPDKLPDVARKGGLYLGRFRRFVGQVKSDIDRELRQEELKKALPGDDVQRIRRLTEEVQQASYALGQQMYAQQQGADPRMGRKLAGLFHKAGLGSVETGVLGGQWSRENDW